MLIIGRLLLLLHSTTSNRLLSRLPVIEGLYYSTNTQSFRSTTLYYNNQQQQGVVVPKTTCRSRRRIKTTLRTTSNNILYDWKPSEQYYQSTINTNNIIMTRWTVCLDCHGEGRKRRRLSKKARYNNNRSIRQDVNDDNGQKKNNNNNNNNNNVPIIIPNSNTQICKSCNGSGLIILKNLLTSKNDNIKGKNNNNNNQINIAIIGGGLSGLALSIACQHRKYMNVTVYERDIHFTQRKQGYGLTMQQAASQLKSLGIVQLPDGITSTKHTVHTSNGTIVGQWGIRHWLGNYNNNNNRKNGIHNNNGNCDDNNINGNNTRKDCDDDDNNNNNVDNQKSNNKKPKNNKRQNIHIARQALRHELYQAAINASKQHNEESSVIRWNHKFIECIEKDNGKIECIFEVNNNNDNNDDKQKQIVRYNADIVVGADGIRSQVRNQLIGDTKMPLQYLGCIVILGICPLSLIKFDNEDQNCSLLDGETVFQTADGTTRIYIMPYSKKNECMWQLSFPMHESDAKDLSSKGPTSLLNEAIHRCNEWHIPIPNILSATPVKLVSGYPVYDRELLTIDKLPQNSHRRITLMGDAAHPMSPFKGQGANQALLDALSLARSLYRCQRLSSHRDNKTNDNNNTDNNDNNVDNSNWLNEAIIQYENEMIERSTVKVKASAEAAKFLHTDIAIQEGNVTRGGAAAAAATSVGYYGKK